MTGTVWPENSPFDRAKEFTHDFNKINFQNDANRVHLTPDHKTLNAFNECAIFLAIINFLAHFCSNLS